MRGDVLDALILETLGDTDVPLSAYAIVDRLHDVRRTTNAMGIYRSLDRLKQRDLIERVESLSAYRLRTAQHAVLMACTQCGSTTTLSARAEYASIEQAVQATGFALKKLALEAVGLCSACR
jgi:Fur family zinc uptake transcriptional regulator